MSVSSFPQSAALAPQVDFPTATLGQAGDAAFEERWAAWGARGRQHHRAFRRKLRIALLAAVVIGPLAALIFAFAGGAR